MIVVIALVALGVGLLLGCLCGLRLAASSLPLVLARLDDAALKRLAAEVADLKHTRGELRGPVPTNHSGLGLSAAQLAQLKDSISGISR